MQFSIVHPILLTCVHSNRHLRFSAGLNLIDERHAFHNNVYIQPKTLRLEFPTA